MEESRQIVSSRAFAQRRESRGSGQFYIPSIEKWSNRGENRSIVRETKVMLYD